MAVACVSVRLIDRSYAGATMPADGNARLSLSMEASRLRHELAVCKELLFQTETKAHNYRRQYEECERERVLVSDQLAKIRCKR